MKTLTLILLLLTGITYSQMTYYFYSKSEDYEWHKFAKENGLTEVFFIIYGKDIIPTTVGYKNRDAALMIINGKLNRYCKDIIYIGCGFEYKFYFIKDFVYEFLYVRNFKRSRI